MFEVGFSEILLIFGIALLVLGPERLPKLAADVGRWAGRARAMARQLRSQLEQEVQFDPLAETTGGAPRAGATHSIQPPPAPGAMPAAHTANDAPQATHGDGTVHVEQVSHEGVSVATAQGAAVTQGTAAPDISNAQAIPSDEPKPG
jgi:Tat protein translocase TatB subunit